MGHFAQTPHGSDMADAAPAGDRGGFRGGFGETGAGGRGRGDRGRGRGDRGRGRGRGKEEKEWIPVTKLGRLVKDGKIKSLEEIYLFSLPIKEHEIIDLFLGPALKDEVLRSCPSRSRPEPASALGSRPSSPSVTTTATSDSASSAARRSPPPSVVPSSWPSSPSFP